MSRIGPDEVRRMAALARLSLSPEETARMTSDLAAILDYVETLESLDTSGVEPTSHVMELATPLREDRAEAPLPPEVAVANASQSEGNAFLVPQVIGEDEEG